jgi:tetratricopeptide (TPR) repeat protein
MSSGILDHQLMTSQAEIHKLKSEYVVACSLHSRILQETSVDLDFYSYGIALLNVAEIGVCIGTPKNDVQSTCEEAREIFKTCNLVTEVILCDTILADLYLREGNLLEAKTLFERSIKSSFKYAEIMSYCLERLGDTNRWGSHDGMSSQTIVFLVHSVGRKEKLGIHKALQFLGDVFLAEDDEHTAISLFTVALEGFTNMDVHRSRAECMLRLGDISKDHGNLLKAVEFWETARPLFEQSSRAKQVEYVDQRLAGVGEDVLQQHRENLAHLAELTVPYTTVEEMDDVSDIEDMEGLELGDKKEFDLVVV